MSEKKKTTSLLGSGIILSFLTLCSRLLGLAREMTKSHFLGTGTYADAFGIAFMIPNLMRRLFAENMVSVAFIPTFKKYLSDNSTDQEVKETKEFLNATLTLLTFVVTCVVILGIIFSPLIVEIFKSDKSTIDVPETAFITRIMFPYLLVVSIAALFQGILNGVKIFSVSGFTPVLFNSIVIAATWIAGAVLFKDIADDNTRQMYITRVMSIGVVAGGCVQALFQLPFVIRTGWSCHFTTLKNAFSNPGTKRVIWLIVPTILGMAAYQINDVVSTALASKYAGEGAVASLQYSLRLQELILGIFAVSIGTVILPDLTGYAKDEKWDDFKNVLVQAIKIITLIAVPVTFFSLINGKEIVSIVYKSGKFDDESVTATLSVFKWHISGLLFIALNRIISPAFYAQGNSKLPTLAGILGVVVNISLAYIMIFAFPFTPDQQIQDAGWLFLSISVPEGAVGIAMALTVASVSNTVFLLLFLKKTHITNVGEIILKSIIYIIKMIIFSIAAGFPAYFVHEWAAEKFSEMGRFSGNGLILASSGIVFAVAGILLLVISRDEILKVLVRKFRRR